MQLAARTQRMLRDACAEAPPGVQSDGAATGGRTLVDGSTAAGPDELCPGDQSHDQLSLLAHALYISVHVSYEMARMKVAEQQAAGAAAAAAARAANAAKAAAAAAAAAARAANAAKAAAAKPAARQRAGAQQAAAPAGDAQQPSSAKLPPATSEALLSGMLCLAELGEAGVQGCCCCLFHLVGNNAVGFAAEGAPRAAAAAFSGGLAGLMARCVAETGGLLVQLGCGGSEGSRDAAALLEASSSWGSGAPRAAASAGCAAASGDGRAAADAAAGAQAATLSQDEAQVGCAWLLSEAANRLGTWSCALNATASRPVAAGAGGTLDGRLRLPTAVLRALLAWRRDTPGAVLQRPAPMATATTACLTAPLPDAAGSEAALQPEAAGSEAAACCEAAADGETAANGEAAANCTAVANCEPAVNPDSVAMQLGWAAHEAALMLSPSALQLLNGSGARLLGAGAWADSPSCENGPSLHDSVTLLWHVQMSSYGVQQALPWHTQAISQTASYSC